MNENDIVDIEQSDESVENSTEVGESVVENGDTEIVLTAEALEELLTEPSEPFPVKIVEEEVEEYEIEPYALNGSYNGTISDTYLDYFEGIVQKLPYDTHYVIWRSGEYAYSMAYGEDIVLNNGRFEGECDVVNLYRDGTNYTSNWFVGYDTDSMNLQADDLFVYSDLGMFPTVARGVSSLEAHTMLFAIGFAVVFGVCSSIFNYVLKHLRS